MGTLTNTENVDFSSGMSTVKAPHLIHKSESLALVNVDIRGGSLRSMPNLNLIEAVSNSHFVEFLDSVYAYDGFRSNAFMDNNMYWTDGVTSGKVLWDGRELPLGMPNPITSPTIALAGLVDPAKGPHKGDFKYCYTFYSTDTGVESGPSPLSSYLIVDEDDIIVSNFEAFPKDSGDIDIADRYRIYRIGGYLPRFTMVDEIEIIDIPYTDSLDDTEIDGRLLQTLRTEAPLQGMNDFVEMNGRLFGSFGAKIYFSALGNPDAWYSSDFYTMPDNITALAKSPAGLLAFGTSYTYLLLGSIPSNFRLKVLSNIIGCVSRESLSYFSENAIWLSETGICMANGYNIVELTIDKIENITGISPTSASVLNNVYYLSFKPNLDPSDLLYPSEDLHPASSKGTNSLEEGIIAIDFKRGDQFSYKMLDYKGISSLGIYNGQVHVVTSIGGTVYLDCTVTLGCEEFLLCSPHSLNILNEYQGQDLAKLSYISPQFIDGSFATLKQYDKIRVNFYGEFDFSVRFSNGEIVVKERLNSIQREDVITLESGLQAILEEDNVVIIGIPNNNNSSYSINFIIEGRGDIKSIQYSWKPRELP